jgi:predicted Co/Zn/Cd cation transporter (cation efflux family)
VAGGTADASNLAMAAFVAQRARHLRSALLWLDVRGWLLGGLMSLAVVLAFVLALVLHGGEWHHWVPYLDSIVLALISLVLLVPARRRWKAMREVPQVAPDDLDRRAAGDAGVRGRARLCRFTSHVAKMGRMLHRDPYWPTCRYAAVVGEVDAMRDEIAVRLDARAARSG